MNFGTCVVTANPCDAAARAPRRRLLRLVLAIAVVLASPAALAKNGDLDTTYGGTGAFLIKDTGVQAYDINMMLQPDGRALVGGTGYDGNMNNYWVFFRRNGNGTPDTSFGAGTGQVKLKIGVPFNGAYGAQMFDFTVQPNGKIIGVGNSTKVGIAYHLVRLLPDGSFDPSFGNGGDVIVAGIAGFPFVALQEDGKIVLTASNNISGSTYVPAAWRYTAAGVLDTSFGNGGIAKMPAEGPAGSSDAPCGLAIRPDGRIVVCVTQESTTLADKVEVIRLTRNGALDTSFGTGGVSTFSFDGSSLSSFRGFTIRPDGEIAGIARTRLSSGLFSTGGFVYRLFHNGNVDGWSTLSIPNVASLGATPANQLLFTQGTAQKLLSTARLRANGNSDTTFTDSAGEQGVVQTAVSSPDAPNMTSVAVQANGRFVVASSDTFVQMARYNGNALVLTPTAFAFTDAIGVPTSTVEISDVITISGLSNSALVPITVVGGSYSINGAPFTSLLGYVKNGDQVMVEHTSAATSNTSVATKLKVGGISDPKSLWAIRGTQTAATFTSTTQ